MLNLGNDAAKVQGGAAFMSGPGGRWAAERLLKAMQEGREIHPRELRTLDGPLPYNAWIEFDTVAIREGLIRAPLVSAMMAAGLTIPVPNAMGKTLFQYDQVTDMSAAVVSLDGVARSDNESIEYKQGQIPLPIVHKDFNLNLRRLEASRSTGEPLDTTQAEVCGRRVGEQNENLLINGGPQFGNLPLYGLLTHPNRNTGGFGTNGNWAQAAKTGANMFADVTTAAAALRAKRFYGPYWLVVPGAYTDVLDNDYAPGTSQSITIRERILKVNGLQQIIVCDQMPANNIVLFQATRDVAAILNGEGTQTVQWDLYGGFAMAFKVFNIQAPAIRATEQGRSGIYHMS